MFWIQIIVIQVLIFGALIYALRQVLTKNISHATTHLDELSADFIRREEELRRKQEEADRYHKEVMDKAQADADRTRHEMEQKTQEQMDTLLAEARAQGEAIVVKAEKTKDVITAELRRTVEARLSERLGECFVAALPPHAREALHNLWVEDLLRGALGDFSTMRLPEDAAEVRLVSAYPLSGDQRAALEKKIKDTFHKKLTLCEEVDAALVGGVLLEIGSLVLDGSVRNRIQQVIHESV